MTPSAGSSCCWPVAAGLPWCVGSGLSPPNPQAWAAVCGGFRLAQSALPWFRRASTWLRAGLAEPACLPCGWPGRWRARARSTADWLIRLGGGLLAVGTNPIKTGIRRLVGALRGCGRHPAWRLVIWASTPAVYGVDQVAALRGLLAGGAELQQRLVFPAKRHCGAGIEPTVSG